MAKKDETEIERIERFFRSRHFSFYSDLDGEDVLRRLKKYAPKSKEKEKSTSTER